MRAYLKALSLIARADTEQTVRPHMYIPHKLLIEPDANATLWRYMDFVKFFAILENSTLFFPRITALEDPFEGHPPRAVVEAFSAIQQDLSEKERKERIAVIRNNIATFRNSRNLISASCWHANETESAAMWNLYLKSGEGIAVRTTFQRLENSFTFGEPMVYGGLVQYVDYETFVPDNVNVLVWAILKRLSFSHENEFRVLTMDDGSMPSGVSVPIDIQSLIAEVYVSPTTPDWMIDLLRNMMKRYGLTQEIIRSELNMPPGYYADEPPAA